MGKVIEELVICKLAQTCLYNNRNPNDPICPHRIPHTEKQSCTVTNCGAKEGGQCVPHKKGGGYAEGD